jgi:hypothetical protein
MFASAWRQKRIAKKAQRCFLHFQTGLGKHLETPDSLEQVMIAASLSEAELI